MNNKLYGLRILAVLLAMISSVDAYIIGDGRGIFSVVVEVQEFKSGNFLDGVAVSMTDSGSEDLASDSELKRYLPLFQPSRTNLVGQSIVYYYDGFSFETDKGQTQGVRGKLTLTKAGYEDVTIELRSILGPGIKTEDKNLPRAKITMKRKP
jgi:hypothetical protein